MKSYVLEYIDESHLVSYTEQNTIADSASLLIQIFTACNDANVIQLLLQEFHALFPLATIIGATTDGEIAGGKVYTQSTIIHFTLFEYTTLSSGAFKGGVNSYENGQKLAQALIGEQTQLLLLFSDGLYTNGEMLLNGINDFNSHVKVAGGMAGDYSTFTETFVFTKDTILSQGTVGVALNSTRLKIFNDYNYNWQKVGKKLTITKCEGNRVYEIDGKSAVETYKEYLGIPVAQRLPSIGIEFPLINHRDGMDVARAVLAKHEDGSLSFAGNMYEGEYVYFGYGDSDEIMKNSHTIPKHMASFAPEAIFVYSCMARRHFIGNSIGEELSPLQALAPMAGFFTYGEFFFHKHNKLLNQTLTVVGLTEESQSHLESQHTAYSLEKMQTYNSVNALIHLVNKTSQEMMEQKVFAETYSRFEQLFEYSGDGIAVVKDYQLIECNQKMLSLYGYQEKKLFLAQTFQALFVEKRDSESIEHILETMQKNRSKHYLFEMECYVQGGSTFWAEVMLTKITIEKEELLYAVFRDISLRKEMETELVSQRDMLYYKAYHDDLTGLPNRKSIMQSIEEEIKLIANTEQKLALLFLDLDKLKIINDSLGHSVGDKLIILIAKRIKKSIAPENIVARLGGDEFLILFKNVNEKSIKNQADKILRSVREEIIFDMHHLYTTASIGIVEYPKDTTDAQILMKYADSAMYEAKERGGNQYYFYSSELTKKAHAQVKLAKEFRRAIRKKEFEIYYQPQMDMKTNRLVGFEALIRWNHPEDGLLSPVNFLPGIEKANLLDRLDKWVMNHAMKEMVKWYEEGLNPGKLALNIAMSELENSHWENKLMKIMSRLCFDPKWLEVEMTETEIMKHPKRVISLLNTLRSNAISIAIDDFGTGYSSLSQLKHLPFDKIKIDKVFIDDLPQSHDAVVMFKTMIALAQNMKIPVLAEGIEKREQAEYLAAHGCQFAQGYYFAKPLSTQDAHALLVSHKEQGRQ